MTETGSSKNKKSASPKEWDSYLREFLAAVPPVDPAALSSVEQTVRYLKELAQRMPESIAATIRAMIELLQEFTNVKGLDFRLQSLRLLDLKMHLLKDADIPLSRDIAGIGRIEFLRLTKLIHLQIEIGDGNSDLRLHIKEGLSLLVSVAFVSGVQELPLKGTARLLRAPNGQILVEATSKVPGIDLPVTVSFPLSKILDEVRKQF